jgi:transketolase
VEATTGTLGQRFANGVGMPRFAEMLGNCRAISEEKVAGIS